MYAVVKRLAIAAAIVLLPSLALAQGTPFRYLDAGPLVNSRTVERLTFITSSLGQQLNSYPRMNWRLLTQPENVAA